MRSLGLCVSATAFAYALPLRTLGELRRSEGRLMDRLHTAWCKVAHQGGPTRRRHCRPRPCYGPLLALGGVAITAIGLLAKNLPG